MFEFTWSKPMADFDSSAFSDFQFPPHVDQKFAKWSRDICQRQIAKEQSFSSPSFFKAENKRFVTQSAESSIEPLQTYGSRQKENVSANLFSLRNQSIQSNKSKSCMNALRALQAKNNELKEENTRLTAKLSRLNQDLSQKDQNIAKILQDHTYTENSFKSKILDLEDSVNREINMRKAVAEGSVSAEEDLKKLLQKEREGKRSSERRQDQLQNSLRILQRQISSMTEKQNNLQSQLATKQRLLKEMAFKHQQSSLQNSQLNKLLNKLKRSLQESQKQLEMSRNNFEDSRRELWQVKDELLRKNKQLRKKDKMLAKVEDKILHQNQLIEDLHRLKLARPVPYQSFDLRPQPVQEKTPIVSPLKYRTSRAASAGSRRARSTKENIYDSLTNNKREERLSQRSCQQAFPLAIYKEMIELQQQSLRLIQTHSRIKKQLESNSSIDAGMRSQLRGRMLQVSGEIGRISRRLGELKASQNQMMI